LDEIRAGARVTPAVTLIKPLRSGGMGSVWLASHATLGNEVVVKFLAKSLHEDEQSRERFTREASAAAQVRSPHVVQTFDYGLLQNGTPFIVMEYLDGLDLGQVVRTRRLGLEQIASIIEQVARALDASHRRGIIHRDVKPANIFMLDVGAKDPFVKLLDFGVAKTTSAMTLTSTGEVVGTPVYMSPEQIAGKPLDHRADLWSLGVVAFRCLTGKRPFDGSTVAEVAYKVVHAPIPKLSDLEPTIALSIEHWFSKACARDIEQRYASARAMADGFWEAVGMPQESSSWTGTSHPRLERAVTVVEPGQDPVTTPAIGEATAGSLRSSVATVMPPARNRTWAVAFAVGLPVALVTGFFASQALNQAAEPGTRGSAAETTDDVVELPATNPTAEPTSDDLEEPAVEPSAAPSASSSASAKATSKPRPRPIYRRPPPPPPSDDLGF
jgi:eukaryotic-like serine/threonine-protein kinase